MKDHFEVLDHGYVQLREYWGTEEQIIEAARMSTGKGFLGWGPRCVNPQCGGSPEPGDTRCTSCMEQCQPGDERLLKYLYTHKHLTPFEMCGLTIEVQAPIFVFREWHRHRTQSYNELSARYTPLPNFNYVPDVRNVLERASLKQGGPVGEAVSSPGDVIVWLTELRELYTEAQRVYDFGLQIGIPKELARLAVPVARYSRMRASANLRNWLQFLALRKHHAAQWEIRQYANCVGELINQIFPRTWELFLADQVKTGV